MINSLNRFIKKSNSEGCKRSNVGDIIENSNTKITLLHERLNKDIIVSLVFDNKESGDEAYVYSYASDDVKVGDCLYSQKYDKHFLAYQKINNVATDDYLCRVKTVVCNVSFKVQDQKYYGFFVSSPRKKLEESVFSSNFLGTLFEGKNILIMQDIPELHVSDCLLIAERQWRIVDYNKIPNPGVVYLTLEQVLNTIEEPVLEQDNSIEEINVLKQGYEYNFATEQGYFSSNPAAEIISKSNENVLIRIPYNINSIEVKIKEMNNIVSYTYEVGE